jgi:catalase (peroxidase I)
VLLELLSAGKAFNRSVADQHIAGLADVIVAGGRLAEKVKALPSGQTVQIVMELGRAIAAATSQVGE